MASVTFPLGQVVSTPGALDALSESGESAYKYLRLHAAGDWGEVDTHDRAANNQAVSSDERILSAYRTRIGTKIWVITEADRSSTCVLLPEEY